MPAPTSRHGHGAQDIARTRGCGDACPGGTVGVVDACRSHQDIDAAFAILAEKGQLQIEKFARVTCTPLRQNIIQLHVVACPAIRIGVFTVSC